MSELYPLHLSPHQVAIIGPGLLGGSIGLTLKKNGLASEIIGVARTQKTLDKALARGCIDVATTDLTIAVKHASLIVIATPLSCFDQIFQQLDDANIKSDAVITDIGSTKQSVVKAARKYLSPNRLKRFVPAHPMAGSEMQGPEFASDQLLVGRPCVIAALDENDDDAVKIVKTFWHLLGMQLLELTPELHDLQSATISHLPHLAAVLLTQTAQDLGGTQMASTGFRDTTRLASSNPKIRADILAKNRDAILVALDCFEEKIKLMKQQISTEDHDVLFENLEQTKIFRDQWLNLFETKKQTKGKK